MDALSLAPLLIANRGEIACRIQRTARRMGLATVAVYSDADRDSLHVAGADQAVRLGPPPARASYLDIDALLAAARRTGARSLHPGYGFLAESAALAEACAAAGLVFVGPSPAAIRAMGDKGGAKRLMEAAGVPVIPGGDAAGSVDFPVLIKAAAGGGGKGMRIVRDPADLPHALDSAAREAQAAFGDGRLILERYLDRPRHVEVQVLADRAGTVWVLGDRDCSLQRRHQKVVEEAPAPGLDESLRGRLHKWAAAAATAAGYEGAGTVEFLVSGNDAFFMEMNTRLQVEHPVTELTCDLDMVEWQLRIAAGEPLPSAPPPARGHAVEARLYAEDPARGFLPSPGRLLHLRFPEGVRVDTGVREGDTVTAWYDPMIAKIATHGATRAEAVARLEAALAATRVLGPATNLAFLRAALAHPAFATARTDVALLDRETLLPPPGPVPAAVAACAALWLQRQREENPATSPWDDAGGWRLNAPPELVFRFRDGPAVRLLPPDEVEVDGERMRAELLAAADGDVALVVDGLRRTARLARDDDRLLVWLDGAWSLSLDTGADDSAPEAEVTGGLTAPLPGRVTRVLAAAGQVVQRGEALLVLEAMKMEHTIRAPADGVVAAVRVAEGDQVAEGTVLAALSPPPALPTHAG